MIKGIAIVVVMLINGGNAHARLGPDTLVANAKSLPIEQRIKRYQLAITSLWLNHPDSAMKYARQAVVFSNHDTKSLAIAVRLLGGVHLYKGDYDSSLICSKIALRLSIQTNDSVLISSAFNNIGFTQYHFGNYASALENLLKSLKLKQKIHNNYGLAQTINNVGLVYTKLKDYKKARHYFTQALDVAQKVNDNNQNCILQTISGSRISASKTTQWPKTTFSNP